MMEKHDRKSKLWGVVITVLFHAAVIALLLTLYLTYPPSDRTPKEWPPVDSAEVLFGGEFVKIGDSPDLAEADTDAPAEAADEPQPEPLQEAAATENSGHPAEPAPVVSSKKPSEAKATEKPKPEKTGPTKAEREAAEKARREEEQRKAIQDRMKNTDFGSKGTGKGSTGQADGNSSTGAASGTPGFNLNGRSLAKYELPPSGPLGSITIRVSVNRQGKVTSAEFQSGTGSAATNTAARNHCIAAARRSQFSVNESAPAQQVGTITYNFR
ncbi:MAG: hypothetical protein NC098_01265 [Lachnoclostridium sp.]|nr:hypothetical protein [Lachnoclostridium sp.]